MNYLRPSQHSLPPIKSLSPERQRLYDALIALYNRVQSAVQQGSAVALKDLQLASGLRTFIKTQGALCPEEVLLVPWRVLIQRFQAHHWPRAVVGLSPNSVTPGALAQVDGLTRHLDEQQVRRLMDAVEGLLLADDPAQLTQAHALIDELFKSDDEEVPQDHWDEFQDRGWVVADPLAVYCSMPSAQKTDDMMSPLALRATLQSARPRIEYYALKLLACAGQINRPLESLTRVVQLHELAHFVTHLGLDSGDRHWDNFKHERKEMIEGCAQELTQQLVDQRARDEHSKPYAKARQRAQEDRDTFYTLLSAQPALYRDFLKWAQLLPSAELRRLFVRMYRVTGDDQKLMRDLPSLYC